MKLICEGKLDKASMLASALEKYKTIFVNTQAKMDVLLKVTTPLISSFKDLR